MFLDIFESAENQQYFKDDTELLWLHGTLLCKRLGFKNVSQAIQMHTEEDERQQLIINGRTVWFVSEYGVWGMILAANTEEAKKFKAKLKREILPKLRADGYYIARTDQQTLERLQKEIIKLQSAKLDLEISNIKAQQDNAKYEVIERILIEDNRIEKMKTLADILRAREERNKHGISLHEYVVDLALDHTKFDDYIHPFLCCAIDIDETPLSLLENNKDREKRLIELENLKKRSTKRQQLTGDLIKQFQYNC